MAAPGMRLWGLLLALGGLRAAGQQAAPLRINAWFALSRVTGDFLNNATHAAAAGYRQIAGSAIDNAASFASVPGGPWYNATEMRRVARARALLREQVRVAHAAGLEFWASYEALNFPARLVERYGEELYNPQQARCIGYRRAKKCISFERPFTRRLFSQQLDEAFAAFPEVQGLVVRYGENSPGPFNVGNAPWDPADPVESLALFIRSLREELCVKRGKTVVFRTWDTQTAGLHANASLYAEVVARVAPHPRLLFSVKHTHLDFWRRTELNPCIGVGAHPQVVEMCVGNLFGGMGAYPSYIGDGVINGFPEVSPRRGLADLLLAFPATVVGIFPVTQGSFGYSLKPAKCLDCAAGTVPRPWLWPSLEFQVLAAWGNDPGSSEEQHFLAVLQKTWGLDASSARSFRRAALLAMAGNLEAETVGVFDAAVTQGRVRPSANFMVVNTLGGLQAMGANGSCRAGPGVPGSGVQNACEVLPWLHAHSAAGKALAGKFKAVQVYEGVKEILARLPLPAALHKAVTVSVRYGSLLFQMIAQGFAVLLEATAPSPNRSRLCGAAAAYNASREALRALWHAGDCPTLYNDEDWAGAVGEAKQGAGLGRDVRRLQAELCTIAQPSAIFLL